MKTEIENAAQAHQISARLLLICAVVMGGIVLLGAIRFVQAAQRPSLPLGTGIVSRAAPSPSSNPALLDINAATLRELDTLPGIGPALAQAIVDTRRALNGFCFVEELMEVPGIGSGRFAQIQGVITCGPRSLFPPPSEPAFH